MFPAWRQRREDLPFFAIGNIVGGAILLPVLWSFCHAIIMFHNTPVFEDSPIVRLLLHDLAYLRWAFIAHLVALPMTVVLLVSGVKLMRGRRGGATLSALYAAYGLVFNAISLTMMYVHLYLPLKNGVTPEGLADGRSTGPVLFMMACYIGGIMYVAALLVAVLRAPPQGCEPERVSPLGRFKCPECGAEMPMREDLEDRLIRCEHCGHKIREPRRDNPCPICGEAMEDMGSQWFIASAFLVGCAALALSPVLYLRAGPFRGPLYPVIVNLVVLCASVPLILVSLNTLRQRKWWCERCKTAVFDTRWPTAEGRRTSGVCPTCGNPTTARYRFYRLSAVSLVVWAALLVSRNVAAPGWYYLVPARLPITGADVIREVVRWSVISFAVVVAVWLFRAAWRRLTSPIAFCVTCKTLVRGRWREAPPPDREVPGAVAPGAPGNADHPSEDSAGG